MKTLALLVSSLACLAACSSVDSVGTDDAADVAGEYSVTLTYGQNGCKVDSWQEGSSLTNIPVTITQTGTAVTATVGGIPAIALVATYGSAKYQGTVDGHHFQAGLFGTATKHAGNCTYTMKSLISAEANGDLVSGTVITQPAGNGNPDCAAVMCTSEQSFNGVRPPKK